MVGSGLGLTPDECPGLGLIGSGWNNPSHAVHDQLTQFLAPETFRYGRRANHNHVGVGTVPATHENRSTLHHV